MEAAQRANQKDVGVVEWANSEVSKEIRALILAIGMLYGRPLPPDHPVYPWLVRHAGWLLSRFIVHSNGKISSPGLMGQSLSR